jgi:predicted  nucleic acid-binding Zn ribbon protein
MFNGQLIGDWNITNISDQLELVCFGPEQDALDIRHHNARSADAFRKLVAQSAKEPEFTFIGPVIDSSEPCRCRAHSGYILQTSFIQLAPPVRCINCEGHLPLYKLPFVANDSDYGAIVFWEGYYKVFDQLYINSDIGELFALKQLRDPKSQLTQQGITICKDLSAKLKRPFYYYLMRRNRNGDPIHDRLCPSCGGEWTTLEEPLGCILRKCETCGIMA